MSFIPSAVLPQYSTVALQIGLKEKLRCLHISDTHLLFSDGRDCRAKYDVALRRWGEFVYTNVGRNVTYFLDALLYAKRNSLLILHTGDLIDFYSPANLEAAERLLKLAGVDCFLCAGNHEYTNYSGQHPETPEEQKEARREVPKIFSNRLDFASRVIGGVNFVAIDNSSGFFPEESFGFFDAEAARGLPMILLIHIPIYTEGLFSMLKDEEKADSFSLCAIPENLFHSIDRCAPTNTATIEFVRRLKSEPLLKAVLAGHIHAHRNHMDELALNLPQMVAGGGYYGCGEIIEII